MVYFWIYLILGLNFLKKKLFINAIKLFNSLPKTIRNETKLSKNFFQRISLFNLCSLRRVLMNKIIIIIISWIRSAIILIF